MAALPPPRAVGKELETQTVMFIRPSGAIYEGYSAPTLLAAQVGTDRQESFLGMGSSLFDIFLGDCLLEAFQAKPFEIAIRHIGMRQERTVTKCVSGFRYCMVSAATRFGSMNSRCKNSACRLLLI